jgi:hypothetical protein
VLRPSLLRRAMVSLAPSFDNYGQHDAQEFLVSLLGLLHDQLNAVKRPPKYEAIAGNHTRNAKGTQNTNKTHARTRIAIAVECTHTNIYRACAHTQAHTHTHAHTHSRTLQLSFRFSRARAECTCASSEPPLATTSRCLFFFR